MNKLQIVTMIIGITLVIEGLASFVIASNDDLLEQSVKIFRITAGFFLIIIVSRRVK